MVEAPGSKQKGTSEAFAFVSLLASFLCGNPGRSMAIPLCDVPEQAGSCSRNSEQKECGVPEENDRLETITDIMTPKRQSAKISPVNAIHIPAPITNEEGSVFLEM